MILILLVGALIIWAFALWSFSSTLEVSYNPLRFWPTLSASFAQGLSVGQVVPALLMLVLIVATPLLVWNLLEDWAANYTPTPEGLRFESLGIAISYPWAGMSSLQQVDDDSDEPLDELIVNSDYTAQISNSLLRFLHSQAYGRRKLPIYAGIEGRDELLATIRQQLAPSSAGQPEAAAQP